MIIHIGNDMTLFCKDIISIHDYSYCNEEIKDKLIKEFGVKCKFTFLVNDKKVKSAIITTNGIFLSGISVNTLRKRASLKYWNCCEEVRKNG